MKILVDENVSMAVVTGLKAESLDVIYMADDEFAGLDDDAVFQLAVKDRRVIITRDRHFTNSLRFPPAETEAIIYVRHGNMTSDQERNVVLGFLKSVDARHIKGSLATIYREGVKIR